MHIVYIYILASIVSSLEPNTHTHSTTVSVLGAHGHTIKFSQTNKGSKRKTRVKVKKKTKIE